MKEKLKKLQLLFSIFLAGLLLFGCEAERDNTQHQENGKIQHIKFEDLIKDTQFKNAYTKIKKGKISGNARTGTVMEQQYNFNILDVPANVMVKDSLTSYTLLIGRDTYDPNSFENLIINIDNYQNATAHIVKFKSETSFEDVPFDLRNFNGEQTAIKIDYNPNPAQSFTDANGCIELEYWTCTSDSHHTSECNQGYLTTIRACPPVGGVPAGGDEGPTNPTNPNPTNPTGGSNSGGTPVVTAPVSPIVRKTPCEALGLAMRIGAGNIKGLANGLKLQMTPDGEAGSSIEKDPTNRYTPAPATPTTENKITFPLTPNTIATIHCHPTLGVAMFSFTDIVSLYDIYDKCKQENIDEVAIYLVARINGNLETYALKVDNPFRFFAMVEDRLAQENSSLTREEKMVEIDQYLSRELNEDLRYEENTFLKIFGSDSGFSLYKANATLTNWSKLVENPTGNLPESQPCN